MLIVQHFKLPASFLSHASKGGQFTQLLLNKADATEAK
jgi:hypothetical protein